MRRPSTDSTFVDNLGRYWSTDVNSGRSREYATKRTAPAATPASTPTQPTNNAKRKTRKNNPERFRSLARTGVTAAAAPVVVVVDDGGVLSVIGAEPTTEGGWCFNNPRRWPNIPTCERHPIWC